MKKISTKNRVIALMLQRPEGITYTEVVKLILAVNKPDATYNWRDYRGYWATNLNERGYMRSGGDGYLYKQDGKWFAKWYDKGELLKQKIERQLEVATSIASRLGYNYADCISRQYTDKSISSTDISRYSNNLQNSLENLKNETTKKINQLIENETKKNK
jgi:hypothetical protein